MKNQKEISQNSKSFSIIPMIKDKEDSKISQYKSNNKISNLSKQSNEEAKNQQLQKENTFSPSPKKYNFNKFQKQQKLDTKNQQNLDSIANIKEERKQLLRKIILAAKSSYDFQNQISNDTGQKSIAEGKNDKIKKYNSDFPTQKNNTNKVDTDNTMKNSNKYNEMPKSISESKINEKAAQNNSRRIVFMIKTSSNIPPKPLTIEETDKEQNHQIYNEEAPNLKRSSSDFPKKFNFNQFSNVKDANSPEKINENAKVTRKSVQSAKLSNNLQNHNQFLIDTKPKQKEADVKEIKKSNKIKKSNSDFPSPKNTKADNLQKDQIKNEPKNKEDLNSTNQITDKSAKSVRKNASTAKSTNILQNDYNMTPISSQPKADKIKKFNSDFPNKKNIEIDDLPKDETKIKKESTNKIPRKPIIATKSSNILQNKNEEFYPAVTPQPPESKIDKIKKSNSAIPDQKAVEIDAKQSKASNKDNVSNKIPRKIAIAAKSSNYPQDQKEESKIRIASQPLYKRADKIEKSSSVLPTQKNLEIDESSQKVDKKQIKKEASIKKIPRIPIATAKSSNALPGQNLQSANSKSDKIKKSNSSFPTQEKESSKSLPKEVKNDNKKPPLSNLSSNSPIKEIEIEIEIENESKPIENPSTTTKPQVSSKSEADQIQIESNINNQQPILDSKIKTREIGIASNNDNQNQSKTHINETHQNNAISEFTPSSNQNKAKTENSSKNYSQNQPISNNTKHKNARKQNNKNKQQEPPSNSPETNSSSSQQQQNASKSNNHKIKNIQIEYKSDKNKQEQKQNEVNSSQKKPSVQINIQKNQNQKQKLNIQIKAKDNSQTKEAEKSKNGSQQQPKDAEKVKNSSQQQPKEAEKVKNSPQQQPKETEKSKNSSQQQPKETEKVKNNSQQHPKEQNQHKQTARQKENRFVWKDTSSSTPTTPKAGKEKENAASTAPASSAAVTTKEVENASKEHQQQQQQQNTPSVTPTSSKDLQQQQVSPVLLQPKEVIPLSECSRLSEETKKQIKYEIEKAQQAMNQSANNNSKQKNVFTFKMNIESQPVCIAVGDIEGDLDKLQQICGFIKANPSLQFVFIGDIVDDLSDACPTSKQSWECLSLLSEFFVTGYNFLLDNNEDQKSDTQNGTNVSLPSAFCDVSFKEVKYGNIRSRVKFLAGNAECDNLLDFQKPGEIVPGEVTNYIFGKDKWKKTVTFEQMCILYRYLKSCHGIIKMKKSAPEGKKNSNDFTDTVYFRHSPSSFKINRFPKNMYSPNPDLKKSDVDKRNFFFITGHCRIFASIQSQVHENKELFYVVDTTVLDAQNQYLKDVGGFGANDRRLAVISFDKEIGFSVKAFSLPFQFPKSTLKCTVTDKYVQIKGI